MRNLSKSLSVLVAAAAAALFGDPVSVTNEFLLIDQDNRPSVTNVLGTVSDVAKLQAQTELNAASANAAEEVYEAATNLLDDVAAELTAERAVVYRSYFLDSFTAVVVIDPEVDKIAIYSWTKQAAANQTVAGREYWDMYFGSTKDLTALTPQVKSCSSLTNGLAGFSFLDPQYVSAPQEQDGSWEDGDGNTFNYLYKITVSIPTEQAHFCILYVNGDAAAATGDTLTIVGGVTGGITTNVVSGNLTLRYTGGLCTGVTDSNAQ